MKQIRTYIVTHKIISTIVIIVILGLVYWIYKSKTNTSGVPQYVLSTVRNGTISQTVTGSGQVSASNQTDIQSQVSGTIQTIDVSVGQQVQAGDLIATIDYSNAAISLKNSEIALAKLKEPAKVTDISNAQGNLDKAYSDAFNAISNAYLDLPTVISGMKDMIYGSGGYLSDQNISNLMTEIRQSRDRAGVEFDAANLLYQQSLTQFKNLSRSGATSSIDNAIDSTHTTIASVSKAVSDLGNTLTMISTLQPTYKQKDNSTAAASVGTWASTVNSDLASLVSAENNVRSSNNSLTTLTNGADAYDLQSAELNLAQQRKTYSNYFIRAPYDGIIGRIPVNVYGQAGNGTVIATIVGMQKIATISLDEVDAAKVKVGQPVSITFDAIDGLNATGTVAVVDQVGTVTQGVVSYGVKININTTDDRIKPGMSVNTTIVTFEKPDVLVVPSSAIKTSGRTSYVEVFDRSVLPQTATSTRSFGQTISTTVAPQKITVTTGTSDNTSTEIVGGLTRGQLVVTRTITSGTAQTTAAPSILSSFGANRGSGATRTAGAAVRPGN